MSSLAGIFPELYLRLMGHVRRTGAFSAVSMVTMRWRRPPSDIAALIKPLLDVTLVARKHTDGYLVPLAIVAIFSGAGARFLTRIRSHGSPNKSWQDLRNALFARMLTPPRATTTTTTLVLVSKVTHEVLGVTSAATVFSPSS